MANTPAKASKQSAKAPGLPVPCSIEDDVISLRGEPSDLVGIATIRHAEEPEESAFKLFTTDIAETRFGYLQRKRFAPLISSSLPNLGQVAPNLSLTRLPAPGQSGRVPVRLSLDPHTPPGNYEAQFDVAGSTQKAMIEVLAVERLSFAPRSLTITASPGEVVKVQLVITNEGNQSLTLGMLGMLVLQEEEQVCLSIQRALAAVKSSKEGEEHRIFLDSLARSLAEKKTDFGRVRLADGEVTLAGGESYCGMAEIHTPRDMAPGAQYRSLLKTRSGQLFVRITAQGRSKKAA